ncbi:ferritin [Porphyromonas circumdentaria]|uniref:Ferritin n=1 Tax=Porphyromonas circumdentaria TaxID=29524 RepID=A0A1T4N0Y0_9PORP|nr:ferritin [Porphyromonas circumdentaria]MBB6276010.1 ferritin [Porphyromonas circumdentaria]MDO4721929.1 ferritin [Porphyromonas circumdentaria]SJZ72882.1 ferritin [Porphyromonas circumdentaria]
MKIGKVVNQAINQQINLEMWSSNLYLSMSMYLQHKGYAGMATWLMRQSKEEMEHAYDMMHFVNRRGGCVTILPLAEVPTEFGSVADVFTKVYEHECLVTSKIEEMVGIASQERDMASQDFFWKYIREQVEEEDTVSGIIDRIKLSKEQSLIFLDEELAKA